MGMRGVVDRDIDTQVKRNIVCRVRVKSFGHHDDVSLRDRRLV